jgi:lipopolysaccharide transport system permease protein
MAAFSRSSKKLFQKQHLIHAFDLLRELIIRDIKVQYKSSMLGMAWTLVTPLMQLIVFYFIFCLVLPLNIPNYPSFAFSGMLVWTWFQMSLLQGASAVTNSRELVRRPGFPIAVLPVVSVLVNFINFLIALPILLIFLLSSGNQLKFTIVLLPILMLLQFIFILSFTYLVAAINVVFRDTQHILNILLNLFFYLTPVFYNVSAIPTQYQMLYYLNPMVHIIGAYRDVLLGGVMPNWFSMLLLGLLASSLLFTSYRIFMKMSYRFAEEL